MLELRCVLVVMTGECTPQEFVDQCTPGEFLSTDFRVDRKTSHAIIALAS